MTGARQARSQTIEHPRDDVEFLAAVLRDSASRGVDRDRVLLAGFSRGGSMVWDLACRAPVMARAYAPIAGAFWEPLSERCAGPVDLYHMAAGVQHEVEPTGQGAAGPGALPAQALIRPALVRLAQIAAHRPAHDAEGGEDVALHQPATDRPPLQRHHGVAPAVDVEQIDRPGAALGQRLPKRAGDGRISA
ncbi:MAG: hypothetical protein AAFV96_17910, partial [Pseudomonadota bacterium]